MQDAAPLFSIAEAPAPAGGGAEWYEGKDHVRLRAALFSPSGRARGSVVLSPGRTEPIEKYFEVVGELLARGFVVLIHDWRGQGLSHKAVSDPLAGWARGWRPFLSDFDLMIAQFQDRLPKPWIAMGHSMGGGLTALVLAEGDTRFAAAVLSAPMLGVNLGRRSPGSVGFMAGLMTLIGRSRAYVAPAPDQLDEPFEGNVLTHDEGRYRRFHALLRADPQLKLGGVTWGWLQFALVLAARVKASRRIEALDIPVVVVAAEKEKLCDNAASEAFARRAPKGRFVLVSGSLHEILMETDPVRAVFWAEFDRTADAVAPA